MKYLPSLVTVDIKLMYEYCLCDTCNHVAKIMAATQFNSAENEENHING